LHYIPKSINTQEAYYLPGKPLYAIQRVQRSGTRDIIILCKEVVSDAARNIRDRVKKFDEIRFTILTDSLMKYDQSAGSSLLRRKLLATA
jgi:hypothetical protein